MKQTLKKLLLTQKLTRPRMETFDVSLASTARKLILLWTARTGTFKTTDVEWKMIAKLIRTYSRAIKADMSKLLRNIKTKDELAVYQIISTLGLDDEEISLISATAFKNELEKSGDGTEANGKIHDEEENW